MLTKIRFSTRLETHKNNFRVIDGIGVYFLPSIVLQIYWINRITNSDFYEKDAEAVDCARRDQATRVTRGEKISATRYTFCTADAIGKNEESLFRRYQVLPRTRSYFALRTSDRLMVFLCREYFFRSHRPFPTGSYPRERVYAVTECHTAINR